MQKNRRESKRNRLKALQEIDHLTQQGYRNKLKTTEMLEERIHVKEKKQYVEMLSGELSEARTDMPPKSFGFGRNYEN